MWWFDLSEGFHIILHTLVLVCVVGSSSTINDINNTNNTTESTASTPSTSTEVDPKQEGPPYDLKTWAVVTGAGILLLLFIVNIISVIQRRNDHRVIQTYLLTLHTLIPFLRNYDDIATNEQNIEGKTQPKQQQDSRPNLTEYDEIEMVQASRSKYTEVQTNRSSKEIEKTSNQGNEENNKQLVQERDSVYSLQKQMQSTNL